MFSLCLSVMKVELEKICFCCNFFVNDRLSWAISKQVIPKIKAAAIFIASYLSIPVDVHLFQNHHDHILPCNMVIYHMYYALKQFQYFFECYFPNHIRHMASNSEMMCALDLDNELGSQMGKTIFSPTGSTQCNINSAM